MSNKAIVALGALVLAVLCGIADARPGGGQSFSSGRSSSSGGSHSSGGGFHSSGGTYHSGGGSSGGGGSPIDSGTLIALLVAGGFVLLVILLISSRTSTHAAWNSSRVKNEPPPPLDLTPITAGDPDFSRAVFEDFVYQLYSAAHRVRHDANTLVRLAPYLSAETRDLLAKRGPQIEQVVIGSLWIMEASRDSDAGASRLVVGIEANLSRRDGTLAVKERWTFVRAAGVRTKSPERTRTWPCPSCGAPWQAGTTPGTCSYCQAVVEGGRFDWMVDRIVVEAETPVGRTLTGTVEEIGNDYPTLRDPNAQTLLMQLRQQDPNVTWEALMAHVQMIYTRLNEAWNGQDLTPVRGLVTASLLSYLVFWIDEYRRQHLANKLENATVKHISLARVTRDRFYDAITVRVYAMGFDVTLDAKGKVVGGSKSVNREYTEYWTLLRSSARRGPIVNEPRCPNCGAPLAISDAGACTHCGSEVENGSFDWVLSKIEQDDVYRG